MTKIKRIQKILRVVLIIVLLIVVGIVVFYLHGAGIFWEVLQMILMGLGMVGFLMGFGELLSGVSRKIKDEFDASLSKEEIMIGSSMLFGGVVLFIVGFL